MATPVQISIVLKSFPAVFAIVGAACIYWGLHYQSEGVIYFGILVILFSALCWWYFVETEDKFRRDFSY